MTRIPLETVQKFLDNTMNPGVVEELVAADATYISLNYNNPELKAILPWTGTDKGPQAFIDTFSRISLYWEIKKFEVLEIFGAGESVAVFGTFTYKSKTLGKLVTSPYSILAKVRGEKIVFFQFQEDTYATASSFKISGSWKVSSDPAGKPVYI